MRKLIYTIGAAACISLAACTGSSEYDAYVESPQSTPSLRHNPMPHSWRTSPPKQPNSPEKISNSMKNRQRKSPA